MTPHVSPEFCRTRRSPAATASAPAPGKGAATLPNDLVFDILSRLPVRSVCRFRCVSMEWSALISDPAFAAAHNSRHAEPLILASHINGKSGRANLQLMDMDGNIVRAIKGTYGSRLITTSVDYLVCAIDYSYGAVHVIDPAAGKVLVECQHFAIYGFGRAVPSGAYKVVCIKNMIACGVFTLGEDIGWRMSHSPPTTVNYTGRSPVVVNGVMYFSVTRDIYNFTLHRFDLESEEWKKTIKGPEITVGHHVPRRTKGICVTELNRTLCIVQSEINLTHMTNNEHVNIWLLTDPDNDIWIKAYTIPMAVSTYDYMPLRVSHDGGKLIFHCRKRGGGELRVYNSDTKTCASLWKLDKTVDSIYLCNLNLDSFV